MLSNKEKRRYINSVSRKIKCSKKDKADVLAYISSAVDDLVVQNPDITSADLIRSIGEPEAAAKSFSEMIPAQTLKNHKRKIIITVSAIFGFIALLVIMFCFCLIHEHNQPVYVVIESDSTTRNEVWVSTVDETTIEE